MKSLKASWISFSCRWVDFFPLAIRFLLYFWYLTTRVKYVCLLTDLPQVVWELCTLSTCRFKNLLSYLFIVLHLVLHLWIICMFYLFCLLIPVTSFAYLGCPLSSFTVIFFLFYNFKLFDIFFYFLLLSFLKPLLHVSDYNCGRVQFPFPAAKMTSTYLMILFLSSTFSGSLLINFLIFFCSLSYLFF